MEKLELSMMNETIARIQKDMRLVLNERGREENALSTDLWKKSVGFSSYTPSPLKLFYKKN